LLQNDYHVDATAQYCQDDYENQKQNGFMRQGSWGYQDENSHLSKSTCQNIAEYANGVGRYLDVVALRTFCFPSDYKQCLEWIQYEQLWGLNLPVNGSSFEPPIAFF